MAIQWSYCWVATLFSFFSCVGLASVNSEVPALLALEDGTVFRGTSIGAFGSATGEVVFNTSMTGYQEILTDPSYTKQIITLTYPHIGNTGTNEEDFESDKVWAEGLVVRDTPTVLSNFRSQSSFTDFLRTENVIAIAKIDTRELTRLIRERGAMAGCIVAGTGSREGDAVEQAAKFPGLLGNDLVMEVTRQSEIQWTEGGWDLEQGYRKSGGTQFRVVTYDFGVKRNMLRLLVDRGCDVVVVPASTTATQTLSHQPDGVFLSNGPGDPGPCTYAIETIRNLLEEGIPVFGICLGYQLLALASGAKTVKMKYGHHGANHPVKDLETSRVLITSQNHGFCVEESSLPPELEVTHVSLFDETLQGIAHKEKPAFGFQGHPEASPGPQDCRYLFDRFVELMKVHGQARYAQTN